MVLDEENYIKAIGRGDHEAFKALYEEYYALLLNYGQRLTGDTEATREIIQDIFVQIWNLRGRFSLKTSIKSYLLSAMHHRAMNWIRHERIKKIHHDRLLGERIEMSLPAPESNPFLSDLIFAEINRLPERARMAFIETQINELSMKEAAQKMSVSERTVENLLAAARKQLRKKIRKIL